MNNVSWLYQAPHSPLPITYPAFGYQSSDHTDVAETIKRHTPIQDDYELTDQLGYLENIGAFK